MLFDIRVMNRFFECLMDNHQMNLSFKNSRSLDSGEFHRKGVYHLRIFRGCCGRFSK
jgi:hypothetical protein